MHWFNAVCWLFLLLTGLGLIGNEALSPVGAGYPHWVSGLFGGAGNLLIVHAAVGLVWTVVFVAYLLLNPKVHLVGFIREIFNLYPKRDLIWLFRKGVSMTLGERFMKKRGWDTRLPDQGFYNVGQKLFAIPAALGGVVIAITGIVMILSRFTAISTALVQWSILIHFLVVGFTFAGLLIHIYMAAIAPDERPAFWSMFSGKVPKEFARHHNPLWVSTFEKN
jgi:formate dehydrogenase subunit gamma